MTLALSIIGAGAVLTAYFAVSTGKLRANSPGFHALNLFGAALLAACSAVDGAYGFTLLNTVWLAIAARGLVRTER